MRKVLTLFTPAYNRAHTLTRLYESLLAQTSFDFEWLIIDDGSVDNTAQLIKTFDGEGRFPVRYFYKENGGKHTAYNLALEEANGDWFMCIDSDDILMPSTVEDVMCAAQTLGENTGVASYKQDFNRRMLSDPFPQGLQYEKIHRLALYHGCRGEFAFAFPTDFARRFPYPVFSGERFIGECVVYDRMDAVGQMFLLPKVTMLCEYQQDGSSNQFGRLVQNNPKGQCLYFAQRIDLMPSFFSKIVCAGKYRCFSLIAKDKNIKYYGTNLCLVQLCFPLGLAFRVYYKLIRGF